MLRGDNTDGCPAKANVRVEPLEPWAILLQANVQVELRKPRTIPNLTPGRVRLTAGGLGARCFQMNDAVADLTGDSSPILEIRVAGAGFIRGTMRPASAGSRIVLAAVTGDPEAANGNQSLSAYTDAEGDFEYDALRPGRYRISGPDTAATEIEVKSGARTEIELLPTGGSLPKKVQR